MKNLEICQFNCHGKKNIINDKFYPKYILLKIVIFFLTFLTIEATSQISYSCDMESCGSSWDHNGFVDTWGGCGGSGSGTYDNNYYLDDVNSVYNSTAITGHTGGELTITVKTRLLDYDSPYPDRSSTEWGTLKIYYKTTTPSEGSPGTQMGSDITSSSDCQTHSVSVTPGTTISNLYIMFVYTYGGGDNYIIFDDVTVTEATGPSITQSGSLSAFSACSGGNNSAEQTFTVSGSSLTANLVITPPSGYEVSTTSGASFASSVSLTPSSGTVASTTIYVRSTTGASAGDGGDIACTSTGAATENVATGSLTLNSTAITDGSDISGLSSYQGVAGTASSFTTAGTCLSVDLTATAPSNFEVSLSSGSGSSVTLSESGGTVASTTVYVRLAATQRCLKGSLLLQL